jgi:hypothetical protein
LRPTQETLSNTKVFKSYYGKHEQPVYGRAEHSWFYYKMLKIKTCYFCLKKKLSQAQWCTLLVSAIQEGKARGLFDPRSLRAAWATQD